MILYMETEIDTELVESAKQDGILKKFNGSDSVFNEIKRFLGLFEN